MKKLLSVAAISAITLAGLSPAQAILTVRLDGNGLSDFRVSDGDALDTNATVGEIAFDAAAIGAWASGARFDITANNIQTHPSASVGGGQINVMADYDHTGGFFTAITVAVADQFVVSGNTIESFSGSTTITGAGAVTASNHYFHSSTPITPTDPFVFAGYGDSFDLVPGGVGSLLAAEGTRSFFVTPPVTLGIDLQVANQMTLVLGGGDIGTVSSRTVVNPEPASLLLSAFAAIMFGLGYRRRRQLQAEAM